MSATPASENIRTLAVTGNNFLDEAGKAQTGYAEAKLVLADKLLHVTTLTGVNEELDNCRNMGWINTTQEAELLTRAAKYGKIETIKWLKGDPCPVRTDWEESHQKPFSTAGPRRIRGGANGRRTPATARRTN